VWESLYSTDGFPSHQTEDPNGDYMRKHDLSCFRTLFLAGERCDPDTLLWAEKQLGVPIIDHWWQTETGGQSEPIASVGMLPVKPDHAQNLFRAMTYARWAMTVRSYREVKSAISLLSFRCLLVVFLRCGTTMKVFRSHI
jgi:acyl-coenzyme A synthetase/AMP-(fatty) acid ligase